MAAAILVINQKLILGKTMAADTALFVGNSVVGFIVFMMFFCLCIQCVRMCDWLFCWGPHRRIDVLQLLQEIDAKTDTESECGSEERESVSLDDNDAIQVESAV